MPKRINRLNDLSNREWLRETKSFWRVAGGPETGWHEEDIIALAEWLCARYGEERARRMLGQPLPSTCFSIAPPRDLRKLQHPATFSERDIERLLRFFTKSGEHVLDPFVGTGSTLLACYHTGRHGLGIELVRRWAQIAEERLAEASAALEKPSQETEQKIICGEALTELKRLPDNAFDFIVTSPPYWRILNKQGLKIETERLSRGLETKYSEDAADLGNIADYDEFLQRLGAIFRECGRVLKPGRYLAVIVSDFRHRDRFVLYHADLARELEAAGLPLRGITILLQDNKNLYPFGVPYAFVSNIHHQYILIHQKPKAVSASRKTPGGRKSGTKKAALRSSPAAAKEHFQSFFR